MNWNVAVVTICLCFTVLLLAVIAAYVRLRLHNAGFHQRKMQYGIADLQQRVLSLETQHRKET